MSKTRITILIALVTVVGGGLWFYQRAEAGGQPNFRYGTVERTDIQSTVSATGALNAVRTVQVGTQVSGQISAIYVDFNDKVKKGQLIARIDPVLQEQAVAEAGAALERAQAQFQQAKSEYDRNKELYDAKIVTATEFSAIEATHAVAKSNVTSAQISLNRAKQNLDYTSIYAPIDGVVVSRDVDVGQTVAASMSTPQLFLIANDLSQMQILASVDESDIGRIHNGQDVSFTVSSFPDRTFHGTVEQVRLQSATTENVVNYTAVVRVQNPDGRLMPGMTATVKFVTDTADGVLAVPNTALRFQPTPEMLAGGTTAVRTDSVTRGARPAGNGAAAGPRGNGAAAGAGGPGGADGMMRRAGGRDSTATLWTVKGGKLTAIRV
ncbi:MAG: efflux RND transporter periplasmic adaptor subunit, partial [Gemmatimonadaceae bacterium]